jgi:hypothetical protein
VVHVPNERIVGRRSGIVAPEFIPLADAVKDTVEYESWSRFCLENMESLLSRAAAAGIIVPDRALG